MRVWEGRTAIFAVKFGEDGSITTIRPRGCKCRTFLGVILRPGKRGTACCETFRAEEIMVTYITRTRMSMGAKFGIWIGLVTLCLVGPCAARADTIYTYTGNPYTSVGGTYATQSPFLSITFDVASGTPLDNLPPMWLAGGGRGAG
jgi:hypothetical protein